MLGKEHELSVNLISPYSDINSFKAIKMRGFSRDELTIAMQQDFDFVRDLKHWKQTDKFIRQSRAESFSTGRDRIIAEKNEQNGSRAKNLEVRLCKLIGQATLYVHGEELKIGGEDAQEHIQKAFQTLIEKVYVNLPILRNVTFSEADLNRVTNLDSGLFRTTGTGLAEAEQDILDFIQTQANNGIRVSVKFLLEHRTKKPYGCPDIAILCIVASLSGKGKIEARSDSLVIEGDSLVTALKNSRTLSSMLLSRQAEFTSAQIRKAKDLYRDLFGVPTDASDANALGVEWSEALNKLNIDINNLIDREQGYPFVKTLLPLRNQLKGMADKLHSWFITELVKQENELLDAKENILDKIRNFMGGSQRKIYDEVHDFLTLQETNISYVDIMSGNKLRNNLADPECYKSSSIQNLKEDFHNLKEKVDLKILDARKAIEASVDECTKKISLLPEFQSLDQDRQKQIIQNINDHKTEIKTVTLIAVLQDRTANIHSELLPKALSNIELLSKQVAQPKFDKFGCVDKTMDAKTQQSYINAKEIQVSFFKLYLSEEVDVDTYLNELRKSLLAEIRDGKKVVI